MQGYFDRINNNQIIRRSRFKDNNTKVQATQQHIQ